MQHKRDVPTDLAATMRAECVASRISRLHRIVARRFDHALRPHGLTLPQIQLLGVLASMPGRSASPTGIARELASERSTISRNLDVLAQRGWVEPATSPSGRTSAVTMTDAGLDALTGALGAWGEAHADLDRTLGPDALAALDTWLDALAADDDR